MYTKPHFRNINYIYNKKEETIWELNVQMFFYRDIPWLDMNNKTTAR